MSKSNSVSLSARQVADRAGLTIASVYSYDQELQPAITMRGRRKRREYDPDLVDRWLVARAELKVLIATRRASLRALKRSA